MDEFGVRSDELDAARGAVCGLNSRIQDVLPSFY